MSVVKATAPSTVSATAGSRLSATWATPPLSSISYSGGTTLNQSSTFAGSTFTLLLPSTTPPLTAQPGQQPPGQLARGRPPNGHSLHSSAGSSQFFSYTVASAPSIHNTLPPPSAEALASRPSILQASMGRSLGSLNNGSAEILTATPSPPAPVVPSRAAAASMYTTNRHILCHSCDRTFQVPSKARGELCTLCGVCPHCDAANLACEQIVCWACRRSSLVYPDENSRSGHSHCPFCHVVVQLQPLPADIPHGEPLTPELYLRVDAAATQALTTAAAAAASSAATAAAATSAGSISESGTGSTATAPTVQQLLAVDLTIVPDLVSSASESPLYVQRWRHSLAIAASAPPKALVLILHGLGDHSGRYAEFAQYLTRRNFWVYGLDFTGHGRSGGALLVLCFFVSRLSWELSLSLTA